MKISKNELRKMILESLILEALSKEDLIQQLVRGDKALDINKFDKDNPLIKNIIKRGITGSSGTVRTGQEAVAYLVHEIFPQVLKTKGINPGSAQSVKFTLQFLQEFGEPGLAAELAKIRPHAGPNYFMKLFNKNPTTMSKKVVEKIGGIDDIMKVAQKAGVIKQGTNVATATNTMTTALQRARPLRVTITKQELEAAREVIRKTAPNVAKDIVQGAKPLSNANTQAAAVVDDVTAAAVKQGPKAAKFARFLKLAGPVGLVLTVIDVFLIPYNLGVHGEFMGFKLGMGLADMATPWGQLTYRRKRLQKPPAKPSDFNDQYKNLIAGLIWNQNKDEQAKEFVMTAIKEDLIDLPAWKEYLAPMREAEKKLKEVNEEFAREEGAGESDEVYDFIDMSKIESLGTSEDASSTKVNDEKGTSKKPTAQKSGWERYIEKTLDKESAKKISKIWAEAAKTNLINASQDYAGFVNWYKKTKNDNKTMKTLGKNAGDDFTPSEALKLIDAAAGGEGTNEHFGKSHGTLIRERYWGRY